MIGDLRRNFEERFKIVILLAYISDQLIISQSIICKHTMHLIAGTDIKVTTPNK